MSLSFPGRFRMPPAQPQLDGIEFDGIAAIEIAPPVNEFPTGSPSGAGNTRKRPAVINSVAPGRTM